MVPLDIGPGVPAPLSTSAIFDPIREKPGRGAGEPLLVLAAPDAGPGLSLYDCVAERVMKPPPSNCGIASFGPPFFLFFFFDIGKERSRPKSYRNVPDRSKVSSLNLTLSELCKLVVELTVDVGSANSL